MVGTGLALLNFGIDEFINPRVRESGLTLVSAAAWAFLDAFVSVSRPSCSRSTARGSRAVAVTSKVTS